ncbi:MAG: hypothetical protein AVDCRST_MAG68-4859 [uncultured Gemmatimonadetes bacterium]|uniref:Uncharacterized protein n=1 Tax=uncultured Gemmatimonadota bacterium TaxID=203437 RepID=A0A6J4MQJ2_9BACT|nr:MAG: hypothetical protein AVDCRST_MAG68-4859 [uncultured Gemmatimonadota bacterium]
MGVKLRKSTAEPRRAGGVEAWARPAGSAKVKAAKILTPAIRRNPCRACGAGMERLLRISVPPCEASLPLTPSSGAA